jgi:hypothetical protein
MGVRHFLLRSQIRTMHVQMSNERSGLGVVWRVTFLIKQNQFANSGFCGQELPLTTESYSQTKLIRNDITLLCTFITP